MKIINRPSPKNAPVSDSDKTTTRSSKKWIWGAIGVASALALGVAMSRRGLPFLSRKKKFVEKAALPATLATEWQLIEKIDRALQKARIEGIDVYVKNGKVLLVGLPEHQPLLSDARDVILALDGVQSVETSIKSQSLSTPTAAS